MLSAQGLAKRRGNVDPRPAKLAMYINGEWVEPSSGQYIETIDPFTAKPWALVPRGNAEDADRAIQAAHNAFTKGPWRKLHPSERGRIIQRFADLIEQNADELAEIEVCDNGRLLAEMRHQIRYIPRWYHYYAGLADKIEGAVHPCDKSPELLAARTTRRLRRHRSVECATVLFSLKAAPLWPQAALW